VQIRRSWLVVALVAAIAAIPTAAVATHYFSDVSDTSTHARGVEFAAEWGITAGCGTGRFCPADPLTRQQMATFLYRSSGHAPEVGPVANALFLDDTFYYENIVDLTLVGGESHECVAPDPVGYPLGSAIVTHELVSSPGESDLSPAAINVAVDYDGDPAPDGYTVCFQTLDGGPLPAGDYETVLRLSVLMTAEGNGASAQGGASANADHLRSQLPARSTGRG
jgi:hypothetical protein